MKYLGLQTLNLGILILNYGMQIPDLWMDLMSIKQQIESINSQFQNIIMQINNQIQNIQMQNMNVQIPNIGMMENINDINENSMINKIENKVNKIMYNVSFQNSAGVKILLVLDSDITVKEMLDAFFQKINKPEITDKKNEIRFIFNASKIKYNDNRKLKEFFKFFSYSPPSIYVLD